MPDNLSATLFSDLGLDFEQLTGPLSHDGGGVDIRYTSDFEALSEARRQEDDSVQGIWQTDAKKADWRTVVQLSATILSTKSKDIQVAVWMTQALAALHGLKGLAAGLEIVSALTRNLWPVLWPRPDGPDLEPRLAPYFWIDTHLTVEVQKIRISEAVRNSRPFTYQDFVKARQLHRMASNNVAVYESAVAEGEVTLEQIEAAVRGSSDAHLRDGRAGAQAALAALAGLDAAIDGVAGREAPSFAQFRKPLEEIDNLLFQVIKDRGHLAKEPSDAAEPSQALVPKKRSKVRSTMSAQPLPQPEPDEPASLPYIPDRSAAYALLDHAAEWLLAHEPHSPAPYLVKRAVSWESVSLRDVLATLMSRGNDLETILQVLGIDEAGRPAANRSRSSIFDDG